MNDSPLNLSRVAITVTEKYVQYTCADDSVEDWLTREDRTRLWHEFLNVGQYMRYLHAEIVYGESRAGMTSANFHFSDRKAAAAAYDKIMFDAVELIRIRIQESGEANWIDIQDYDYDTTNL
jgi:hypothetical protein